MSAFKRQGSFKNRLVKSAGSILGSSAAISRALSLQGKRRSFKGGDKKVPGGVKRGSYGNSRVVKLSRSIDSHVTFPDKVEATLCTTMCGYIAAAGATAAAGNYMSIMVNALPSAFNGGVYKMTTGTGTATFAFNASLINGYTITNNPMGYSVYSGLYTNYRVMAYKVVVTVNPAQAADTCRLVVLPMGGEEIPSTSAGSVNLRVLEEQPYALATTCSSGVASGPTISNTLTLSGCPYKDLGLTRQQYYDAPPTSVASQPAASIEDFVGIYLQQLNGTGNGQALSVQIKLEQICQFSDLLQQVA